MSMPQRQMQGVSTVWHLSNLWPPTGFLKLRLDLFKIVTASKGCMVVLWSTLRTYCTKCRVAGLHGQSTCRSGEESQSSSAVKVLMFFSGCPPFRKSSLDIMSLGCAGLQSVDLPTILFTYLRFNNVTRQRLLNFHFSFRNNAAWILTERKLFQARLAKQLSYFRPGPTRDTTAVLYYYIQNEDEDAYDGSMLQFYRCCNGRLRSVRVAC